MKGIIMAGGEGSRLRPLTCDLPKPMVPVMNKPVMAYSIELLKKYGIKDIGVTLQYRPEQIIDYFQDGFEYGVRLNYFIEETPLGTAGSVKNTGDFLNQPFVVISGDALTDIDLDSAIRFHKANNSIATLVLKRVEIPLDYGVVVTNDSGEITRFLEKPKWGEVFSDTVNTGIYILEPKVLEYFETGKRFDFSKDLFPLLLEDKQPMFGYITDGYWCDIGNSHTYLTAHFDMLSARIKHQIDAKERSNNIFIGEGVKIDEGVMLEGPCFIGDYCRIEKGAQIGPYTVIGDHCFIDTDASIKRSVIWKNVSIGKRAEIRGAVLCSKSEIHNRVSIFEGAVIGAGCQLKEGATIKPQVKIWPDKSIEEGSIVQSNIIWGTKTVRYLFGKDGISDLTDISISPQTIIRIGASLGAFLGPDKKVAVSCDNHPGNIMLKHGLISGLLSTGLEVFDLGPLTTPVMRFSVKRLGLDAGIHLFFSNMNNTHIHIVDSSGNNLSPSSERKVENLFIRDDYSRKSFKDIKPVNTMYDIPTFYIRSLLDNVITKELQRKNYSILISTGSSRIGNYILHQVLNELGCKVKKCKNNLAKVMQEGNYDLGCRLDYNGETIELFDEKGKRISKEKQTALINLLYLKCNPEGKIAVPYTAPSIIDELAREYNCSVVRTKSSKQAIMKEAIGTDLFLLYFDGTALLTKILERMAIDNVPFSSLIKEIPEFYVQEREIPCPWNKKGTVMRNLIEEETKGKKKIEMFEGIRVNNDKGWALILPDSDEPICRVYSEGFTEEYAEELANFYETRIKEIQAEGD